MMAISRRGLLGIVPAAIGPTAAAGASPIMDLSAACAAFQSASAALPGTARAMDQAAAAAMAREAEWHDLRDRIDQLLDLIEVTPPKTQAEAAAKLAVGRVLMTEGLDPGRSRFLAFAKDGAEGLAEGSKPPRD